MKKRIISFMLSTCMLINILPFTAMAEKNNSANYNEDNVTWIGSQSDYQNTLDDFFVEGAYKVKVGDKWGIVDATGGFIAPPIYDTIEAMYIPIDEMRGKEIPLFVGGYTQCVRDGKMGLLNQYGEEVIPAKYHAVGLPSEGMSRVIQVTNNIPYLGYWNLELNKEIIAPNKYIAVGGNSTPEGVAVVRSNLDGDSLFSGIGGSQNPDDGAVLGNYDEIELKGQNRMASENDFFDGYAFVSTGEYSKDTQKTESLGGSGTAMYGTILDKNGKEVLPDGPYLHRSEIYPRFGSYMVYVDISSQPYIYNGENLGHVYETGVVGPEGVIIPAQYTGGVRTPIEGPYIADAGMTIIPEKKLVLTNKNVYPNQEGGGRTGVVDFNNKTVTPFKHYFSSLQYIQSEKIFRGGSPDGLQIYDDNGKPINNQFYFDWSRDEANTLANGYTYAIKHHSTDIDGKYNSYFTDWFVNVKTGEEFSPNMEKHGYAPYTMFSKHGLVWVQNPEFKWGLLNGKGDIIQPYKYDAVSPVGWEDNENGIAIVNQGHKKGIIASDGSTILPFEYDNISSFSNDTMIIEKDDLCGLFSIPDKKVIIPCVYENIGGSPTYVGISDTCATPVETSDGYALVGANGQLISGSNYDVIYNAREGLFSTNEGQIGSDGKMIFPTDIDYSNNNKLANSSMTLVVKDGKVGYINSGLLAHPSQPKPLMPSKATATPSPMKLLVNGKNVSVDAYTIEGSNYIKIRDMAYFLNGSEKNYQVSWDNGKSAINLSTNSPYKTVAGDMSTGNGTAKSAVRSTADIYTDELKSNLTAYDIGGNNFFKLRDVMRMLDVYVGYDNGFVTIDTSKSYELTESEKKGVTPAPNFVPQGKTTNVLTIEKLPVTEYYLTKQPKFDTTGMEVIYYDNDGNKHGVPISDLIFTADGTKIYDGYSFSTSSIKNATVSYKGITKEFRIFVYLGDDIPDVEPVPESTESQIAEGKYTISCLGNTLGLSNGWAILDSKTPVPFEVIKKDDYYYIAQDNISNYGYLAVSPINHQLITTANKDHATKWDIAHLGGDTYSVRVHDNPKQLVNASGSKSDDGTIVIVYNHTDTPKNGVLTFTSVN